MRVLLLVLLYGCRCVYPNKYTMSIHPNTIRAYKKNEEHTLRIQSQHSLNSHINTPKTIPLEHDLAHLLAVPEGIHGRFGEEDLAATGVDLHLVEEGVVPEVLHVVPFLDDAVLHRIGNLEHGASSGGLVAAHDVLDDHAVRVGPALFGSQYRSSHDRGKLVLGEVLGGVPDF